jgi:hypothetical protein
MAEVKTGILVTAKDGASPTLRTIGKTGGAALKGLSASAERVSKGLKMVGMSVIAVNQAMNLGRKVWSMLDSTIGAAIETALKFRSSNDQSAKTLADMGKNLELVKARIGDALLPALVGLAKTFEPVIKATLAWLQENQKLVASKFAEYLFKIGSTLTDVVAKGIWLVTTAWAGWREIIAAVQFAVNEMFAWLLKGVDRGLTAMAALTGAFGKNGLTDSLYEAASATKGLGHEFERSADKAFDELTTIAAEHKVLEAKIESSANSAQKFWAAAHAGMQAESKKATSGMIKDQEAVAKAAAEAAEAAKKTKEANAAYFAKVDAQQEEVRKRNFDRLVEVTNQQAEADKAADQERMERSQAIANETSARISEVVIAGMQGQQEMNDAMVTILQDTMNQMIQLLIQKAVTAITANAAEGASSAAAANAGVPVVGPALAAGAAATMFALIMALKGKMMGFNKGGIVPGSGNSDTVPAMLTPGEVVIPAPVVRQYAGRGGGSTQVNLSMHSIAPPTNKADLRKQLRDVVGPELKRLIRNGQLKLA